MLRVVGDLPKKHPQFVVDSPWTPASHPSGAAAVHPPGLPEEVRAAERRNFLADENHPYVKQKMGFNGF